MEKITSNDSLKGIVEKILKERKSIQSVFFVGCGASRSDLHPAYYFLNNNAQKLRASVHTAEEFNLAMPKAVNEHAVVICCSLGGSTPETAKSTKLAKEKGAYVVSFTHTEGSAITEFADEVILFDWANNGYASKRDKMIKVLYLATEILQQTEGYEHYEKMLNAFEKIYPAINNAVKTVRPEAKVFAEKYKDVDILYVMSSGATQEVAWSFSSCLMMEMQWIASSTFNSGDFFHGPFEMVEENVPYLLFMNEGPTREMDARAMTFLQRFNTNYTVVDSKDYGLSGIVGKEVVEYFDPVIICSVTRIYAEELATIRNHPLTKRRYMWKLEY